MKNLLLPILMFFTLQIIYSQEPSGINILVGTNIPNYKSSDVITTPGAPSPFIGIGLNYGYHETYNFQFEIAYAPHNVKFENFDSKQKTYNFGGELQAGFYLNYYVIKPEEDKFYFGPQAGVNFILGAVKSEGGFSSLDRYEPSGINGIDLNNSSNWGYGVGIGVTGGYNKFRFNLRYNHGLSNTLGFVGKKGQPGSYLSNDFPYTGKLSSISFTLSYRVFSKN